MRFQAPRGTEDVLPGQSHRWLRLEREFLGLCRLYGYSEIRTPTFEDTELFVRLVNMLLVGIPRASAVALVSVDPANIVAAPVQLLHWDRRLATGGEFQPSERLIREALRRRQSVLHVWDAGKESIGVQFTMSEGHDWAFCTPVSGEASEGWSIYATGRFDAFAPAGSTPTSRPADNRRRALRAQAGCDPAKTGWQRRPG